MVRGKNEIKQIENKAKRRTTLTKRRKSLEDKADDFFNLTQSEGAVIVFSDAGNCNVFAHPDVHAVLNRYDAESSSELAGEAGKGGNGGLVRDGSGVEEEEEEEEEASALTEAQKRIGEAVENGRWNEAVEDLGVQELDELYAELLIIKRKLEARTMEIAAARGKEIAAAEKDIPDGGSSIGNSSRGGSS